jgi:hypothetical protein
VKKGALGDFVVCGEEVNIVWERIRRGWYFEGAGEVSCAQDWGLIEDF